MGGFNVNDQACSFLDCETNDWRGFAAFPPVIRPAATVVKHFGKDLYWWVTGGLTDSEAAAVSVTESTHFLDEDLQWSEGPPLRNPRYGHCMVQIDDCKVAVIGGSADIVTAISRNPPEHVIDVYNLGKGKWEPGPESVTRRLKQTGPNCISFSPFFLDCQIWCFPQSVANCWIFRLLKPLLP